MYRTFTVFTGICTALGNYRSQICDAFEIKKNSVIRTPVCKIEHKVARVDHLISFIFLLKIGKGIIRITVLFFP